MLFANIETFESEKFQYILIPKNAGRTIHELVFGSYPDAKYTQNIIDDSKIIWTVIRDPLERFLSGLDYDLQRQKLNLDDINIEDVFNFINFNKPDGLKGNINHASSQIPYIINTRIKYYINIDDLDVFSQIHFQKKIHLNKNSNRKKLNLDEIEIKKYLKNDYYVYNSIMNSPLLWRWQYGKIF